MFKLSGRPGQRQRLTEERLRGAEGVDEATTGLRISLGNENILIQLGSKWPSADGPQNTSDPNKFGGLRPYVYRLKCSFPPSWKSGYGLTD